MAIAKAPSSPASELDMSKAIANMTKREKRELLRRRGKILDTREVNERVVESPSQSPGQKKQMLAHLEQQKTQG